MEAVLFIIFVGLAGGIAEGLQSLMESMSTQRLGLYAK